MCNRCRLTDGSRSCAVFAASGPASCFAFALSGVRELAKATRYFPKGATRLDDWTRFRRIHCLHFYSWRKRSKTQCILAIGNYFTHDKKWGRGIGSQTWTFAGEHRVTVEPSRENSWSMSSREHDVGSARKSVADREAFATARSGDAMEN